MTASLTENEQWKIFAKCLTPLQNCYFLYLMDWIYCVTIIQLSVNRQSFHQVFHKKNVVKLENDCNVCALRESVNGVAGTSPATPTMRSWDRNFFGLVVTMFYNNTLALKSVETL